MVTIQELHQITNQAPAATWPFTAVSTTLFGMRVLSRFRFQKEALGWDDFFISLSWVLDIVRATSMQMAVNATRKVQITNEPETVPSAAFWVVFIDAWSFFSIGIPKLGIGILICRIFRPKTKIKIFVITFCICLNILATVGFIITFVQCNPVAGQFNPWKYPEVKCWDRSVQIIYSSTTSGFSALTDIGFSLWPGFVIWGLQMPTWRRLSTIALMGLGVASFAFAVVKLIANTTLIGHPDILTLLHDGIYIGIWNSIENDFVLSAACLPTVPPVIRAFRRALTGKLKTISRSAYIKSIDTIELGGLSAKPVNISTAGLVSGSQVPEVDSAHPYSQVFDDTT